MHGSYRNKTNKFRGQIFLCIFIVVLLTGHFLWSNKTASSSSIRELTAELVFNGKEVILDQTDPSLLSFIKNNHLFPPSRKPYNLSNPLGDPAIESNQWTIALSYLGNKTGGFFIECGANDGEFLSPTLVLERDYGWKGLLIEGDPNIIPDLFAKHRKAWIANVCLSTNPYPQLTSMVKQTYGKGGGILKYGWNINKILTANDSSTFTVKCLPFFSIMAALGVFEVDIFVLDIELSEIPVLKTIPFDKIYIKVFVIEVQEAVKNDIIPLMMSKRYRCMGVLKVHKDFVFVHERLFQSPWSPKAFGKCEL